jgi:hypothetical protein
MLTWISDNVKSLLQSGGSCRPVSLYPVHSFTSTFNRVAYISSQLGAYAESRAGGTASIYVDTPFGETQLASCAFSTLTLTFYQSYNRMEAIRGW